MNFTREKNKFWRKKTPTDYFESIEWRRLPTIWSINKLKIVLIPSNWIEWIFVFCKIGFSWKKRTYLFGVVVGEWKLCVRAHIKCLTISLLHPSHRISMDIFPSVRDSDIQGRCVLCTVHYEMFAPFRNSLNWKKWH